MLQLQDETPVKLQQCCNNFLVAANLENPCDRIDAQNVHCGVAAPVTLEKLLVLEATRSPTRLISAIDADANLELLRSSRHKDAVCCADDVWERAVLSAHRVKSRD
jgi:hypothetical protein